MTNYLEVEIAVETDFEFFQVIGSQERAMRFVDFLFAYSTFVDFSKFPDEFELDLRKFFPLPDKV